MDINKTAAIIAEYDPFHNGHVYHISETKRITGAEAVIAVMSGDFVQRGRPAILDKWQRASLAVKGGADIVFELPFAFACNNAGAFARGAVEIINGLGCVSHLVFGSESGDIARISEAARLIGEESESLSAAIKLELGKGSSFPSARYEALKAVSPAAADVLRNSNDILGAEYVKELYRIGSIIEPVAVKRKTAMYNDTELHEGMSSATAIRVSLSQGKFDNIRTSVPEETFIVLSEDAYTDICDERLFDFIRFKVMSQTADEISAVYSVGEGLENRLKREIVYARNYNELADVVKSKRYTETRIKRLLIHLLIGFTKSDWKAIESESGCYARVLAFSKTGAALLRQIKNNDTCKSRIITNINKELVEDERLQKLLMFDLRAADIYNLLRGREVYRYSDRTQKPSAIL